MTATPALKTAANDQNIYKQYQTSNFTNLPNNFCQTRFKGDKKPSAHEVYVYLYSLPTDWKISVKNVARHFDVGEKYIQECFSIIIKNDCMIRIRERSLNGRMGKMIYKLFAPQVEKRPMVENIYKQLKQKEKYKNQPLVEKRHMDTYYKQNKDIKNKQTTAPPPEPPPDKPPEPPEKQPKAIDADDILNLRKQLPPEINFRINNTDLSEHLGISDDHIKWAVSEALKPWVNNPVGMFRSKCRQEMPPSPPIPPKTKPIDKNFNNDKNDLTVKLHDIDFGKYEFDIKKCWLQIKELCKRSSIYFYARIDSQAAMQRGISAITILNALNNTIDNWDNVNDNPKAYFESQCGMKWG